MKTIKRKYNTYDFSELNESAKERVRQWYLDDDMRSSDWENEIEQDLMIMFPNSDLHIQFSLNSCQGDGVNIYGELIPEDLVKVKDFYGDLAVLKNIEPFELPEGFEENSILNSRRMHDIHTALHGAWKRCLMTMRMFLMKRLKYAASMQYP